MRVKMMFLASLCVACVWMVGCNESENGDGDKKADGNKSAENEGKTLLKPNVAAAPVDEAQAMAGKKAAKAADKGSLASYAPKKPQTLDQLFASLNLPEVVATVGDKKITREELISEIKSQLPPMFKGKPLPPQVQAAVAGNLKQVVDSVVNRTVLLKLATADGVKPSPELVEKGFDKYLAEIPPQQKAMIEKQLAAQGSSLAKKRAEAAADKGAQEMAAINQWIETVVVPKCGVKDSDVKKYYDEHAKEFTKPATVSVAHILVKPDAMTMQQKQTLSVEDKAAFAKNADEKAKKKATALLDKLKNGADFAKLAKEESDCPSKADGGKLPPFPKDIVSRGGMDPAFAKAALALNKKGELSSVVKSAYGYHIIKLLDLNDATTTPYDKVKDDLKKYLDKKALEKTIPKMLDDEKAKLGVKVLI